MRDALEAFRPDLVHVTSPGVVGRKALKHATRRGVPTLAVEQSPDLEDHRPADAVLVTASWMLERVRQTGATGELTVVLPTFDLLVHPGATETCCHPLREAAAAGVPVVAPRAVGAADVVRHLETGLLYDPDERHGLLRAVDALAADRHRHPLGGRARELSTRSWTEAVDELAELVERHYAARS